MKFAIKALLAILIFAATAQASVTYSFTGRSSDGRTHAFTVVTPTWLRPVGTTAIEFPASKITCQSANCGDVMYFSVEIVGGIQVVQIQFNDTNGTGYVYLFPAGALTKRGTYSTTGIHSGTLAVRNN